MQFNSVTYISFFLIIYLAYRSVPHKFQNIILLISSYIFYGSWDVRFLFLLVLSTVFNFYCGIIFRTGVISLKQRIKFSLWLILAIFIFIVFPRDHLPVTHNIFTLHIDWGALWNWGESWKIVIMLFISILFFNLLYPILMSIDENRRRKTVLFLGISGNLFILGFFKYYNFFLENIQSVLSLLSMYPDRFHLDIILPIGVSFFTFKGISYVVDSYRGRIEINHSYSDFAIFMAFFPSIIAGPIDRGSAFLKQICKTRELSWNQSISGVHLFIYGLFKKVVIADGVVNTVTSVFDSTGRNSWIDVVVATVLFTIQIYCDFSGYTDMARGTAKLLGINLIENFNLPYFSKNPREFWSRWHISLSSWLRDYLYIPMGGNRQGALKTHSNLIITMVLGGLWHGAAWNFVLWGLYSGIILSVHRIINSIRSASNESSIFKNVAKITFFFLVTCYGWLLFRAPSLDKIISLTSTLLFDFGNLDLHVTWLRMAAVIGLPIFFVIEVVEEIGGGRPFYEKMPVPVWTALYAALIFSIAIGLTTESTQFIYMVF